MDLMSFEHLPLSSTVIGGANFVILAKSRKAVRIADLFVMKPASHEHLLLTPEGERLVRIQIGGFVEGIEVMRFSDPDGNQHSYLTSAPGIRLSATDHFRYPPGVLAGMRLLPNKEQELVHMHFNKRTRANIEAYEYTVTPGPLYIGAGKTPTFFPIEVLKNDGSVCVPEQQPSEP